MNRKNIWSRRQRKKFTYKVYLLTVPFIIILITGFSLHYSNKFHQTQILKRYCGDFGIYGKSLTLFKDGTFNFNYHGCSQSSGHVKGEWAIEDNKLILVPIEPSEILNKSYLIDGINLTSNKIDETGFMICEFYEDQIERLMKEEK